MAIVTGASRGIGASIARRLASEGIAVIINYAGRAEDAHGIMILDVVEQSIIGSVRQAG